MIEMGMSAMVELEYLRHIYAREVTNGMWCLASAFLLASLIRFLAPRLLQNPIIWHNGIDIKLAWGIALIATGSFLRAGWIWALLIATDIGNVGAVNILVSISWISYAAIALGVWGCVCTVKAITEAANAKLSIVYLWVYWLFVVAVTVTVPLAVNALF